MAEMATIFKVPIDGPGALAITPRPRGGDWLDDDVAALAQNGVGVLVSLLCADEAHDLGLQDEAAVCAQHNIEFISLPVTDMCAPDERSDFIAEVHRLAGLMSGGASVAVHCRQSIGRSGVLAVSIAIATGLEFESALDAVSAARGLRVPETREQLDWLRRNVGRLSSRAT
jgi:protein-tyrosine phosphatase